MAVTPESKSPLLRSYFRRARWNTDSWSWEIFSCIFSIIATVMVAVLVFLYDNKPPPRLPYNVGLNSVIAVIGTVSKSSLLLTITSCISQYKWVNFTDARSLQDLQLYDEASRGPWGSFMLLVNRKALYWVKLGALATVISMAFDPVYQALISIEQKPKYYDDSGVTVKRALSFDGTNYIRGGVTGFFANDWNRALTNAVLSDEMTLETNPSCPTGNCTFPVFSSLAFCSNCIDILQFQLQHSNCTQLKDPYGPDYAYKYNIDCAYWLPVPSPGLNFQHYDEAISQNHTSANGTWSFEEGAAYLTQNTPSFMIEWLMNASEEDIVDTNIGEIHLPDGEIITSAFTAMALLKLAPWTGSVSKSFLDSAHICALSVCAREYNVSVTSGLLRTEIVSTSYSKVITHDDPDRRYIGNSSYTFTFPNAINDFTFVSNKSVSQEQNGEFSSTTFEQKAASILKKSFGFSLLTTTDQYTDDFGSTSTADTLLSGLNASTNIPKTMDRVAAAMTNRLRDMSNFTVQGQSRSMELYIRVSWRWLLLPISTVIFGTLFLIATIITTRKLKLPVWKTSELTLMFHGLDFPVDDTLEMNRASQMEDIASALQVRLGTGSNGALKLKRESEEQ